MTSIEIVKLTNYKLQVWLYILIIIFFYHCTKFISKLFILEKIKNKEKHRIINKKHTAYYASLILFPTITNLSATIGEFMTLFVVSGNLFV